MNHNDLTSLIQRLRGLYPIGPIGEDGEPEFGWRDFSGPAPEGMKLPTSLDLEAASALEEMQEHLDRFYALLGADATKMAVVPIAIRDAAIRWAKIPDSGSYGGDGPSVEDVCEELSDAVDDWVGLGPRATIEEVNQIIENLP